MPDILIRGMEMPETCAICKIRSCNSYCPLNIEIKFFFDPSNTGFDFCTGRHSDCPLHELPPHGDLILKDDAIVAVKLLSDLCPEYRKILAVLWDQIKDLPVIIQESEEAANDPKT